MAEKKMRGKLLKIVIRENGKVVMELLPTKQNEIKASRMSCMGYEVINVYEE